MANNNSVLAIAQLLGRHSYEIIQWADSEFATKTDAVSNTDISIITETAINSIASKYDSNESNNEEQ